MSEYEDFNDSNIYLKSFSDNNMKEININDILNNYIKLLDIYHLLFKKNIATKKLNYIDFIYNQGMKCIRHIFVLLLHHTKNITFTHYHCEKGIYYFTEFISQIENENSFLKLSSIDAVIFVYKKTIYNINKKLSANGKSECVDQISQIIDVICKITDKQNYESVKKLYPLIANKNLKKIIPKIDLLIGDINDKNKLTEQLKNVLSK